MKITKIETPSVGAFHVTTDSGEYVVSLLRDGAAFTEDYTVETPDGSEYSVNKEGGCVTGTVDAAFEGALWSYGDFEAEFLKQSAQ